MDIISALNSIPVSEVSYQEWVGIGMALQNEGYGVEVWDEWSRNDSRYHAGECERKWSTFHGSDNPITAASIVQMARSYGWKPFEGDGAIDWDGEISLDGDETFEKNKKFHPGGELITYLKTLFDMNDKVSFVTTSFKDSDGKWKPGGAGYSDRTAGELIAELEKYKDDIGAVIGDWEKEAGAWIRFNPVDGNGVRNENVTKFKYALVESDNMSIPAQEAALRKLELPIAVLVHSGGKSLHAIVRVDAASYDEYRRRIDFLYSFLEKNGMKVDKQNRNPSRLSRMPGVTRGESNQFIVATNIGKVSWDKWIDFAEGIDDDLPDLVSLDTYKDNLPVLPEELIKGVLRCGHKMLISGSSKAGKSFLLMELCMSIAEGVPWLGFDVKKGKVLYVNLEIDPASCIHRFVNIYKALKVTPKNTNNIVIWNLRGHAVPLDKLVPKIIRRIKDQNYTAVIIDPIYKVITGDENSASEMGAFCNQFDKICTQTGCSAIYCHHHSKGAQGSKRAMDRASGSGVFARDPDAQLDMIQLDLTDDVINNVRDGNATAWRLECSLREFENFKPINFWFEYPVHTLDKSGTLGDMYVEGSQEANLAKSPKRTTPEERYETLSTAYDACALELPVTVTDLAEYSGKAEKTIREYIKEFSDEFINKNGVVLRREKGQNHT